MKSNYIGNKSDQRKLAIEVAKEEIDKCYDAWAQDCAYHGLALCFEVLHKEFGFGAERLQKLRRGIQSELDMMEHGVLGKTYAESDIRKWLHSIGIEFGE